MRDGVSLLFALHELTVSLCPHHPERPIPTSIEHLVEPPSETSARIIIDLTIDDGDDEDDDVVFIDHKRSQDEDEIIFVTRPLALPSSKQPVTPAPKPIKVDPFDLCDASESYSLCRKISTTSKAINEPLHPVVSLEVSTVSPIKKELSCESKQRSETRGRQASSSAFDLEAYLSSSSRRFLGFPSQGFIDLSVDD